MNPEKYISLKRDGNDLILEWGKPIVKARLVMVDECILRVDYHIDRECIMEKIYFPKGFNHQPFLKCDIWNKATADVADGRIIYHFDKL